jgi:hypothetical protein
VRALRSLDHPLLFVVFAGMAILGLANIAKWGADKAGLFGLKSALPQ